MSVGVLALQGAITPHITMLESIGIRTVRVTKAEHFSQIERLIIPGGESTTMLRILDRENLWNSLTEFVHTKPTWGTCAGAILLAKEVVNPSQRSLKMINIRAERNAYGSQLDSFKTSLKTTCLGSPIEVDFIRAPKLYPLDSSVTVLAHDNQQPVLLQEKNILVSSFHVELGTDARLHRYFANM